MSIHIGHIDRNASAEQAWLRGCRQGPSTGKSAMVGPAPGELAPGDAAARRAFIADRFAKGANAFRDIPHPIPAVHVPGLLEIAVAPYSHFTVIHPHDVPGDYPPPYTVDVTTGDYMVNHQHPAWATGDPLDVLAAVAMWFDYTPSSSWPGIMQVRPFIRTAAHWSAEANGGSALSRGGLALQVLSYDRDGEDQREEQFFWHPYLWEAPATGSQLLGNPSFPDLEEDIGFGYGNVPPWFHTDADREYKVGVSIFVDAQGENGGEAHSMLYGALKWVWIERRIG